MRSFLVVALWASVSHARRVQTTIEQPASSRTKSLASYLLAIQPVRSNLNRQIRTQIAPKNGRTSPVHMISAANTAMGDGVVHFSWQDIGSGDIGTQLSKMTGPCVQELDQRTRQMTEFNDNFDKFIAAAQSQGVMEMLRGPGPFTLLVPVDSSIKQNVDAKAHILQGKFSLADLAAGGTAQTLAGTSVEYRKALKLVKVNDASVKAVFNAADHRGGTLSTAFPFDVECTNGVIHAIDEPLVATNEQLSYTPSSNAPASAPAVAAPAGGGGQSFADYMASRGAPAPPAYAPAPAGGGAQMNAEEAAKRRWLAKLEEDSKQPWGNNQALNTVVAEECQKGDDEACSALNAEEAAKRRWLAKFDDDSRPLRANEALNQVVVEDCQAGDDEACKALKTGEAAKRTWFSRLQLRRARIESSEGWDDKDWLATPVVHGWNDRSWLTTPAKSSKQSLHVY